MSWLLHLHLIPLFGFYLAVVFILSTGLRVSQYRAILRLVGRVPGRWPKLFQLVKQHSSIFLTWKTVLPMALSLGLLILNAIAGRWIWPTAEERVTGAFLLELWPVLPAVLLSALAMTAFDAYGTWKVSAVDETMLHKYFDQAEFWLRSWTAPVVHFFTFGYINPRKMVAVEVRKALEDASQMLNNTLWWVVIQTGLRILCGLSLWGTYAFEERIRHLLG
jgi:hypothetical protein